MTSDNFNLKPVSMLNENSAARPKTENSADPRNQKKWQTKQKLSIRDKLCKESVRWRERGRKIDWEGEREGEKESRTKQSQN